MQVGDLVKVISEWTHHNPWLKLTDSEPFGLIVSEMWSPDGQYVVFINGEKQVFKRTQLKLVEKK